MPSQAIRPPQQPPPSAARKLAHGPALVGAPTAWFLQQQTNYALAPFAHRYGLTWALYASSALFALIAVACGLIAARAWRSPDPAASDGEAGERMRFVGAVGVMTSALFLLLILIQGLSVLVFPPSET